jgi:hypothetical protein
VTTGFSVTGSKFSLGVDDTGGQFGAGVNDSDDSVF